MGFQYIRILLYDMDSREDLTGQIYYLYDEENQESFGEYGAGNFDDGFTTTEYYGEVEIIYHDVDERILAGTFWYDVVNENGDIPNNYKNADNIVLHPNTRLPLYEYFITNTGSLFCDIQETSYKEYEYSEDLECFQYSNQVLLT